jgi:hypothetical protein
MVGGKSGNNIGIGEKTFFGSWIFDTDSLPERS